MNGENKIDHKSKWQEEEDKIKFEAVEALPVLGLLASVLFITIVVYLAHP
jgi:hypothetical protein